MAESLITVMAWLLYTFAGAFFVCTVGAAIVTITIILDTIRR